MVLTLLFRDVFRACLQRVRTSLWVIEAEIGNWRAETGVRKQPVLPQIPRAVAAETARCRPNCRQCREYLGGAEGSGRDRPVSVKSQSGANLSLRVNSLLNRENAGNF